MLPIIGPWVLVRTDLLRARASAPCFLEANKIKGFLSLPSSYHPLREGFGYDAVENAYVCRNEKLLYYHGIKMDKGFANHYYHARVKDCSVCPFKKIVVETKGDKALLSVSTATITNACRQERVESKEGKKMTVLET